MADDEAHVKFCGNPDCRVAETDACVEGFDLDACPRYGRHPEHETADDLAKGDAPIDGSVHNIRLMSAETLTLSEASGLLRAGDARVVAILGPPSSGKTSLIASLYDLFQNSAVAGAEFAGSRTLHAFERACHDARSPSRRREPDMSRTARGGVRFYHLELGGGPAEDGLSLIMGDRSGEEYRDVADDAAIASGFHEVVRADSLTLLVDGQRLLGTGERHNLRSEVLLMLQALHDGNGFPFGSRLAVVLTKLDAVLDSSQAERADADFERLFDLLRMRFGNALSGIQRFRIAASPRTATLKKGTGVADLLAFWLQPSIALPPPARPIPAFERAFARLMPLDEFEEGNG